MYAVCSCIKKLGPLDFARAVVCVICLKYAFLLPLHFLLQLLDWATHRGADEDRLITFYHLADGLALFSFSPPLSYLPHYISVCLYSVAGKLKGLFLLFAGYIVKSAASHLERTNCEDHTEADTSQGILKHFIKIPELRTQTVNS